MLLNYPAIYRDRHGAVATTIQNDGTTLRMAVRGIEFCGKDFDGLEPSKTDLDSLSSFTLARGDLCACTIECEIPVPIVGADTSEALLQVRLELGEPDAIGGIDREYLQLGLLISGKRFISSGKSGWFEDELLDLQKQLPEGMYLKACINCAFSDYDPTGHGLFGSLACFRGNKDGYRLVRSKADLFKIWHTMTEYVQETYLCTDFERRSPGTGYRG